MTKLNVEGSGLIYSSFLGGSGGELGLGIAVDSFGNAHIMGLTDSFDLPTRCALRATYAGGFFDAFVTKMDSTGSGLIYSTYLGGSDADFGGGLAVDSLHNAYVTGFTLSPDFPVVSPIQPTLGSNFSDIFITKLIPAFGDGSCTEPAPTLTSILISRKRKRVDYLIAGSKTKKHFLTVFGSGFSTGTHLLIDETQVEILSVSSDVLIARLPPGRVGSVGVWPVQARNPDG